MWYCSFYLSRRFEYSTAYLWNLGVLTFITIGYKFAFVVSEKKTIYTEYKVFYCKCLKCYSIFLIIVKRAKEKVTKIKTSA